MKKVAILIDGGFLSKTIYHSLDKQHINPKNVTPVLKKLLKDNEELFRVYYYDAPPFDRVLTNPVSGKKRDYSDSPMFDAMEKFHRKLAEQEYIALRRGKIAFKGWKLTKRALAKVREGYKVTEDELKKLKPNQKLDLISAEDLTPEFAQKAVDMRIGLDIASFATKRIIDKIILVAGDNDFIPAMKFARKEGLRVAVAQIAGLNSDMKQHADEIIKLGIEGFVGDEESIPDKIIARKKASPIK